MMPQSGTIVTMLTHNFLAYTGNGRVEQFHIYTPVGGIHDIQFYNRKDFVKGFQQQSILGCIFCVNCGVVLVLCQHAQELFRIAGSNGDLFFLIGFRGRNLLVCFRAGLRDKAVIVTVGLVDSGFLFLLCCSHIQKRIGYRIGRRNCLNIECTDLNTCIVSVQHILCQCNSIILDGNLFCA